MPLPGSGADVVLRIDQIGQDRTWLPLTVRTQLGKVVAMGQRLDPATGYTAGSTGWLADGVANWIGWSPGPARTGPWASDARTLIHGPHPPKSIVQPPLVSGASATKVRQQYGFGQYAVDCLITTYGEPPFLAFAKGVLQEQLGAEIASTRAFHKPFSQVDQGCMTWIREQAA
jgi:hypothetical protein